MERMLGKSVIVTGSASGIGRATANLFADEGAKVAIVDIDEQEGQAFADELRAAGKTARFFKQSMTDFATIPNTFKMIADEFGKIDVLVNNAGGDGTLKTVIDCTEAEYDAVLDLNAKGYFFAIQAAYPYLKETKGAVVNVSSMLSEIVYGEGMAPYHASKGAVNQITRSSACALGKDGIRVNAVLPGTIMTESEEGYAKTTCGSVEAYIEQIKDDYFTGRPGKPEDVAYAILFLASDEASQITAAMLPVDGGYIAH